MSIEKARSHLRDRGLEDRVLEFDVSSATVELAARAVGVEPARIAKTLSFDVDGRSVLVVAAGDARVNSSKFKAVFHSKPKMLPAHEVEARIGHGVGGVCPFGANEGVEVYLDRSLQRFDVVYPAAGTAASAVRLSPDELFFCTQPSTWVDVCRLPDEAAGAFLPTRGSRQAEKTVSVRGVSASAVPSPLALRQGSPADIDVLVRLTDEGRAALGSLGIDQWQGGTPRRDVLVEDLARGLTWFATDAASGEELGCMAFCPGGEADYDNLAEGAWLTASPNVPGDGAEPTFACVHRVAVADGARRRGVATFLLGEAVRMAREQGFASVRVDTHPGNGPMRHTLEKCGFARCCTVLITLAEEATKERIGFERVL